MTNDTDQTINVAALREYARQNSRLLEIAAAPGEPVDEVQEYLDTQYLLDWLDEQTRIG